MRRRHFHVFDRNKIVSATQSEKERERPKMPVIIAEIGHREQRTSLRSHRDDSDEQHLCVNRVHDAGQPNDAHHWRGANDAGMSEWRRANTATYANRAPSRRPLHCHR